MKILTILLLLFLSFSGQGEEKQKDGSDLKDYKNSSDNLSEISNKKKKSNKVKRDLMREYNGLFKQKETVCSLVKKSLKMAFIYDKANILNVPESYTERCGKWEKVNK